MQFYLRTIVSKRYQGSISFALIELLDFKILFNIIFFSQKDIFCNDGLFEEFVFMTRISLININIDRILRYKLKFQIVLWYRTNLIDLLYLRRKYIFMAFYDRFQCPSIVCITNENTDLEIEHLLLTDYE